MNFVYLLYVIVHMYACCFYLHTARRCRGVVYRPVLFQRASVVRRMPLVWTAGFLRALKDDLSWCRAVSAQTTPWGNSRSRSLNACRGTRTCTIGARPNKWLWKNVANRQVWRYKQLKAGNNFLLGVTVLSILSINFSFREYYINCFKMEGNCST